MKQQRDFGIDLLRIIATIMVITLHVLGASGVLYEADVSSPIYIIVWVLEVCSYCAVNCYALISGYVGVSSKFHLSSILILWLQVTFWSIFFTVAFGTFQNNLSVVGLIKSCMPILSGVYWYFTAYFCTFFMIPFLNKIVLEMNAITVKKFLIVLLFLFSGLSTLARKDIFFINNGYSAAWLIIMYLIGAILKVHYTYISEKKKKLFWGYICMIFVTLVVKFLLEIIQRSYSFGVIESNFLINYNSPTMIGAAVCLVLFFANLKVDKWKMAIAMFAPMTFGIYLIHTHPLVYEQILQKYLVKLMEGTVLQFIGGVFVTIIGIFGVCSIMEYFRNKIFGILYVSNLCKKIEQKINSVFSK